MNRLMSAAFASLTGACAAYAYDPINGRRRRRQIQDQARHALRRMTRQADVAQRDIRQRARGLAAEMRAMLRHEQVSNDVLKARVAARIGRVVSHPGAIRISARDGEVKLSGPVMNAEIPGLLRQARHVRGVRRVINSLAAASDNAHISALQGAGKPPATNTWNVRQERWSPTTRLWTLGAGAALMVWAIGSRRTPRLLRRLIGFGAAAFAARSASGMPLSRLTGIKAGRRAVDVDKAFHVRAPVDRVFDFWANFTNFPYFMSHVRDVHDLGEGRSRWIVDGPAGVPITWTSTITRLVPNEAIAWRSEPGSIVQSTGQVTFHPEADGSTTLRIRMSYNPPAGAMGHALAKVLGADPRRRMDDDLLRLRTFLERGVPARDAAKSIARDVRVLH